MAHSINVPLLIRGAATACPTLPLASAAMAFMFPMALTIFLSATMIPVRKDGRPIFERLIERMTFESQ